YGVTDGICDWEYMGIATGASFPDALCGGAAAGYQGGVIRLTPPGTLPTPTESRISTNAGMLKDIHLYGGAIAVSDSVWDEILLLTR
ncbi:MAG: cell wall-binding repeat-containing protein, partial [Actinomycetota bacterium]|nr:cell wall-binding repeat-containing protein [Actinomycetota bacterium]